MPESVAGPDSPRKPRFARSSLVQLVGIAATALSLAAWHPWLGGTVGGLLTIAFGVAMELD